MDENVQQAEVELAGLYERLFVAGLKQKLDGISTALGCAEVEEPLNTQLQKLGSIKTAVDQLRRGLEEQEDELAKIVAQTSVLPGLANNGAQIKSLVGVVDARLDNVIAIQARQAESATTDSGTIRRELAAVGTKVDAVLSRQVPTAEQVAAQLHSGLKSSADQTGSAILARVVQEAASLERNVTAQLDSGLKSMTRAIEADLNDVRDKVDELAEDVQELVATSGARFSELETANTKGIGAVQMQLQADLRDQAVAVQRTQTRLMWLIAFGLLQMAAMGYLLISAAPR